MTVFSFCKCVVRQSWLMTSRVWCYCPDSWSGTGTLFRGQDEECRLCIITFAFVSSRPISTYACVLSHSIVSDSLRPYGAKPVRLLCPWNSPGKNAGVGCHCLLQGIIPTQGLNPRPLCLLHCRRILYLVSHRGRLIIWKYYFITFCSLWLWRRISLSLSSHFELTWLFSWPVVTILEEK